MQSLPNPFIGKNYLDLNHNLSVPPTYWLARLYDFDADLVVFPSQQVPFAYCLARRARKTAGLNTGVLGEGATPDTKICLRHSLLPITLIYRHNTTAWSIDNIIEDLKARDTWALGGSKKVADLLDTRDQAQRDAIAKQIRDDFWNRSGDAYRSYKLRTGAATASGGTLAQASRRSNPTTATPTVGL